MIKSIVNFKDFASNPISGVLLLSLIALGYLYVDKKLNNKFIETLKSINE